MPKGALFFTLSFPVLNEKATSILNSSLKRFHIIDGGTTRMKTILKLNSTEVAAMVVLNFYS